MKILTVDTYYPAFLERHYGEHAGLAQCGYDEQLTSLMGRCFGTADAYGACFRDLGHQAADVVVNCDPLQLRWAAEHGAAVWYRRLAGLVKERGVTAARRAIARAQVDEYDPDVIYAQDLSFHSFRDLDRMRRRGRLVVGQIASRPPVVERLRRFDLITTSFPHFVPRFRSQGIDSEYLRIGFLPKVLGKLRDERIEPSPEADRPYSASFVGGIDPRVHGRGTDLVERLCRRCEVDVWGYGADALSRDSPILERYHGEAWGLDMYAILARSKIAINRHIDAAEDYSNNMRLYEATGVGALLMTEASQNLDSLLKPGQEAIAYEGLDDLVEKVRYFSEHDEERCRVAAAGQARTLSCHTYEQVIAELAGILESRLEHR